MKLKLIIPALLLTCCASPKNENAIETKADSVEHAAIPEETEVLQENFEDNGTCACSGRAYLVDTDTTGTNIRDTPKGNIIGKLKYDKDCDCEIISFTEAKDGWLKLDAGGWVHGSLFEVATRNYGGGKVYLMSAPTEESDVVKEFDVEKTFNIVGCCGSWLQVEDSDGTVGWLTEEMICANPLTNCS